MREVAQFLKMKFEPMDFREDIKRRNLIISICCFFVTRDFTHSDYGEVAEWLKVTVC